MSDKFIKITLLIFLIYMILSVFFILKVKKTWEVETCLSEKEKCDQVFEIIKKKECNYNLFDTSKPFCYVFKNYYVYCEEEDQNINECVVIPILFYNKIFK